MQLISANIEGEIVREREIYLNLVYFACSVSRSILYIENKKITVFKIMHTY